MSENYFVMIRKQKKIELLDFLQNTSETDLNKCLALFSFKTGLRLEVVRNYYDELKLAGKIS